jgi:hypothetical protein
MAWNRQGDIDSMAVFECLLKLFPMSQHHSYFRGMNHMKETLKRIDRLFVLVGTACFRSLSFIHCRSVVSGTPRHLNACRVQMDAKALVTAQTCHMKVYISNYSNQKSVNRKCMFS